MPGRLKMQCVRLAVGSGVQRGANGAPAPGIQGRGASKE